jgi:hypothetical protein
MIVRACSREVYGVGRISALGLGFVLDVGMFLALLVVTYLASARTVSGIGSPK